MTNYFIRRILLSFLTVLVASFAVFMLMRAIPGTVVDAMIAQYMGLSEIIVLNLIIHNLAFQLVEILLFNDSNSDRKARLKYDSNVFKKS